MPRRRKYSAEFKREAVALGSTPNLELFTDPVRRLDILLIHRLHRHKAHVRPAHRLTDRLGIPGIVLVALHIRLYKLRWYQLHRVTSRLKLPSPVMRTGTRFHANLTAWFCLSNNSLSH